ncbi:uncharacterized protein HD556DRAFT_1348841 [Suillus plorans]|uniref:Uncharacterized protein n=1 Tax=Suillus plorans TaxID=116603 RepID=A0A9P7DN07_9AGAM|nr:uncharacterized protein HD556DRAFT_1348841 [Suillus plorans]KAG1798911.1 hypothetical protein HD556DRAFT_1348841 [Suillus plorans]
MIASRLHIPRVFGVSSILPPLSCLVTTLAMESCIALSPCNLSVFFALYCLLDDYPSTALYRSLMLVELPLSDICILSLAVS